MSDLIKESLIRQYDKTLDILAQTIERYDPALWANESDYQYPAWQAAYHALFYGNIYCAPNEKAIIKWPKRKKNYHLFMKTKKQEFDEIYSKEDVLEFLEFFRSKINEYLKGFISEEDCWPHWYDENQLEFHINNIRHIQHHTAEIIERANSIKPFMYDWR